MALDSWPDWSVAKLQECYMRGLSPDETAALIGRSKDDVCEKARELGLLIVPSQMESPAIAPDDATPLSRRIRSRHNDEPALPGLFDKG